MVMTIEERRRRGRERKRAKRLDPEYRAAERKRNAERMAALRRDPGYLETDRKRNARRMAVLRRDPEYREREAAASRDRYARYAQDPAYRERRREMDRRSYWRRTALSVTVKPWPWAWVPRTGLAQVFPPSMYYDDPFNTVARWEWTGHDLTGHIDYLPPVEPHPHHDAVATYEWAIRIANQGARA